MNWIPPEDSLIEGPHPDKSAGQNIKGLKKNNIDSETITDTELISNSEEETFLIGEKIANLLTDGSVVALEGTLGSGKTCLTKGIASGLKINETITSPTYTIISEYPIPGQRAVMYHIDAYRLNNEEDFEQIGGSEIINSGCIVIIEWSERIQKSLPDKKITVTLEISGPSTRLIKVKVQS